MRVGRTISLALGEAGYDVAVHFSSSGEAAGEVEARVEPAGVRLTLPPPSDGGEERIALPVAASRKNR